MRARARGMTLSMVGIGLFKTQGLDEYGTAAVGCLRGAGLKATEGPAEQRGRVVREGGTERGRQGGREDPNACSHMPPCAQVCHTDGHRQTHNRPHMTRTDAGNTLVSLNGTGN